MNEGAAKAIRRNAGKSGISNNEARAIGLVLSYPGKETKALWASLTHKQRGEWRRRLDPSMAQLRKADRIVQAWYADTKSFTQPAVVSFAFRRLNAATVQSIPAEAR